MATDKRPLDELSQEEINQLSDEELYSRIEVEKDDHGKAMEYHQEERSKKQRVADNSFRSTKVTDDYQTWRSDPSRYDFEGVDTVSREYKEQRAEQALGRAKEKGLVSEFVEASSTSELPGNKTSSHKGTYEAGVRKVGVRQDLDREEKASVLAHEVGHAVDFGDAATSGAAMQGLGLGEIDPVTTGEETLETVGAPAPQTKPAEEVKEISKQRRGEYTESRKGYRENPTELFADFFGEAILQPRNTKARTKNTRERMSEVFETSEGKEQSREFVEEQFGSSFLP